MNRGLSPRTPWTAVIHGGENTINPETQESIGRTDFTVNAEYTDGAWTYTSYSSSATDAANSLSGTATHNAQLPTPPSVVGMLGLRIPDRPSTSVSIGR